MSQTMVKTKVSLFVLRNNGREKVVLGEVVLDQPKYRYKELQESYKRSKTKVMNDDEEISWIREIYVNSFGCFKRPDEEMIYACYPEEIIKGLSFDELPQREVYDDKLELCDGIVADYDDDRECFFTRVERLGEKVNLELFVLEDEDVAEIENLKQTFMKFWRQRDQLITRSQDAIKEKIIPHINRKKELKKDPPAPKPEKIVIRNIPQFEKPTYPDITVEEFQKEYRLHTITVSSGFEYKFGDVILDYRKGDDSLDVITVRIDLSNEDVDYCIKGFDCEG